MAIFGWSSAKMAQPADRARLAQAAAELLLPPVQSANEKVPHLGSGAGAIADISAKSTR
jgi:hypothetical protein